MRATCFSVLAALFLVHAAPAQTASYSYFGAGCVSPPFTVTGLPTLGGSFSVTTWPSWGTPGFFGSSFSVIVTGFSNQSWNGVALPYAYPTANPCGSLLVSPDFILTVPATGGTLVSMSFTIPSEPSLLGLAFYQQVARLWSSCSKMGCSGPFVHFTPGGEGVIGY